MVRSKLPIMFVLAGGLFVLAALLLAMTPPAMAQGGEAPPLHPAFSLVDADGNHVLESGEPVSTMNTCGTCHDAEFIAGHSFHVDVGLADYTEAGDLEYSREWDTSTGLFGRWDPLNYRYLSPVGDDRIDLTTADWIATLGRRHVGGGPAEISRTGESLLDIDPDAANLDASSVNAETGELESWDWQESGVVEMNCFLCHFTSSNNASRLDALSSGDFGWANSATLDGSGIIAQVDGAWQWNDAAFDEDGLLLAEHILISDPRVENCGQCHGLVHVDAQTPMILNECAPSQWNTITTGQIFSPQRLSESGINLEGKEDLGRSWDIHAERVVSCVDCHYALNNPIYYQETSGGAPDHLTFDPRRIDFGEYLYRPLHEFAKGQSAQNVLAPELDNTLRRCESCHEADTVHDWLPYHDTHFEALSCESCHIPQLYAPARQYNDWTVLTSDNVQHSVCRGVDLIGETFGTALISGYEPVLLPRLNADGTIKLAPHNLVTSWYWVYGDPARPVAQRDLEAAWFEGDDYAPDVLALFDVNGNRQIDADELIIDSVEKEHLITIRMEYLGLDNPRIMGDVRPYAINHNVTHGEWATRECEACHSEDSRLYAPIVLADRMPQDVMPDTISSPTTVMNGDIHVDEHGRLVYQPQHNEDVTNLYVFGRDSVGWIDGLGALMFLGVLAGITLHSTLRYVAARRRAGGHGHEQRVKREYMYSLYERQWHWLQTAAIMGLLFTGLIIHKPDTFGIFSFAYVVQVHNVLAAILVINAALAAFYHFASGEIKQFLPEPRGFFSQSIEQAMYYVRGIFRGDAHAFQKSKSRKMNPLQQVTYLAILNVLLPLQIITGALMWGVQQWPGVAQALGGLPLLAPLHTLVAWSFASFIVMHVYLTTTVGRRPTDGIQAMVMGWEDIEVDDADALNNNVSEGESA